MPAFIAWAGQRAALHDSTESKVGIGFLLSAWMVILPDRSGIVSLEQTISRRHALSRTKRSMSAARLSRIERLKQLEVCLPVEGRTERCPDVGRLLDRIFAAQARKAAALYG